MTRTPEFKILFHESIFDVINELYDKDYNPRSEGDTMRLINDFKYFKQNELEIIWNSMFDKMKIYPKIKISKYFHNTYKGKSFEPWPPGFLEECYDIARDEIPFALADKTLDEEQKLKWCLFKALDAK